MSFFFTGLKFDDEDDAKNAKTKKNTSDALNGPTQVWNYSSMDGKQYQVRLRTDIFFVTVNGSKVASTLKSKSNQVDIAFNLGEDQFRLLGTKSRSSKRLCFSLTVNGSDSGVVESGGL